MYGLYLLPHCLERTYKESSSNLRSGCGIIMKLRDKPDFKALRRLAKDRPLLLQAVKEYEQLWDEDSKLITKGKEII